VVDLDISDGFDDSTFLSAVVEDDGSVYFNTTPFGF
jgi:hypothetical protein